MQIISILLQLPGGIPPKEPLWYEKISGILAIPVTLIGFVYSYVLIKKTNLEAQKTQLEIKEKIHALQAQPDTGIAEHHSAALGPLITFTIGSLLLRYVLLELILSLSDVIREPISYFFNALTMGISVGMRGSLSGGMEATLIFILSQFGSVLGSVIYWTIFFILGWPLFKDILHFFNVSTDGMGVRDIVRTMFNWRKFSKDLRESSARNDSAS
jgi:hypothetical protein